MMFDSILARLPKFFAPLRVVLEAGIDSKKSPLTLLS
jgi:hypothetical protein